MKKSVKVLLIVLCVLLAIGLGCIGVGIVLGGDFTAVLRDITMDLYTRVQGTVLK